MFIMSMLSFKDRQATANDVLLIIYREIIIEPPVFYFMFIQPSQNSNMFFTLPFFLNLYQLVTFVLRPLNNLNEMIILPLNKLKDHFIL